MLQYIKLTKYTTVYRTQYKEHSAKRRVQNAERRTQNAEQRAQNTESRKQKAEPRKQNTESRKQNIEYRTQNTEYRNTCSLNYLWTSTFLGPKWHSLNGLMPFHSAQKSLNFQDTIPSHLHL
jgi:hypothetical protein